MKNLLTWLSRRRFPYTPLIQVNIYRERLLHNLHEFRKIAPNQTIAPVLKSNAYGHGLIEVAQILETKQDPKSKKQNSIPFFIVDSYFEAIALRSQGIKTPLLIIGYTQPETILHSSLPHTSFAITTLETLRDIKQTRKTTNIHLKIDTGMHRQGILPEEIDTALEIIKSSPCIILEGICTHLSDVDNADHSFTEKQIGTWNSIAAQFRNTFSSLRWIHASATYGHTFTKKINANISRLGIGLYGIAEGSEDISKLNLQPVMEMKTIITGIKTLKKGETIGYNNTFTAPHDMQVATIPVGYYEGLNRRLSNTGSLLVGKDRVVCPIVGRVSMNITSIDVSKIPTLKVGDEVVVISNDPRDPNSISSIVKMSEGTIPYEIVTRVPSHLKRVVV